MNRMMDGLFACAMLGCNTLQSDSLGVEPEAGCPDDYCQSPASDSHVCVDLALGVPSDDLLALDMYRKASEHKLGRAHPRLLQ